MEVLASCPLSNECERVLKLWDLYAEQTNVPTLVSVRTEDEGRQLFIVSRSISAMDLSTILNYGAQQRTAGECQGERDARARMLSALGIKEAA